MIQLVTNLLYRLSSILVKVSGKFASFLAFALIAVTIYDVTLRYLFQSGSVAVQELEWQLFSGIFLLGSAYTLQRDGHVRVDVVYSRLSVRAKACIDLLGTVFFLGPFCIIALKHSLPFVMRSFELNERSADPGGLPMLYLSKGLLIFGFSLLCLEGIAQFMRQLTILADPTQASRTARDSGGSRYAGGA